jgi:broad specificity phosphatase PhoE
MTMLRRLVLVRHGETDGDSSVRFHGSSDVALSAEGSAQMRAVSASLGDERLDLVVASPLRRAWRSAWIVGRGAPVQLDADFREIHFGRWEGLTKEEIQASDPALYEDWQNRAEGFEFPGGEPRAEFRERVQKGIDRLLSAPVRSALVVVHKGVIRTIAQTLIGEDPSEERLQLGSAIQLTRHRGTWSEGRRSSNPPGVE